MKDNRMLLMKCINSELWEIKRSKNNIYSQQHCTCNENGNESVTIEYDKTFLQSLFRKPSTIKSFENIDGKWCHLNTKKEVKNQDLFEILGVIDSIELNNFIHYDLHMGIK